MINWELFPTIKTERVCLRQMTGADVDSIFSIFSNPEVARYWSSPPMTTRDEAVQHLGVGHSNFRYRKAFNWGVADLASDKLIGTSTLFNFHEESRRAEIGYALHRDLWGKGFMREALTALLEYAFGEMNLYRIEADVDPRNTGSVRTVERLGFQQEGYLRQRWQVAGEIQDALFFGLLKPEWEARKAKQA